MGARHAGIQGVRVDRKGTPWEPFDGEPDLTVDSVFELADALGVR
jgi:2-haloacid dehalogenase